jgi:hypothetical protein
MQINDEAIRRHMVESRVPERDLEKYDGQRWDTQELAADFEVLGFLAPFVAVRRKADGVKGSLEFVHSPRVYFDFRPHPVGRN